MAADTWYRVAMLTPLPPEIGTKVAMVLDPVDGDADPVVRYSTMVMSVVGVGCSWGSSPAARSSGAVGRESVADARLGDEVPRLEGSGSSFFRSAPR